MDASNANTNQAAKSSRRSRWRRCQDDIADPRARSACMCSPRRPFPTGTAHRRSACSRDYRGDSQSQVQARRLSQRRGVVPAAARRVGLPSASLAAGPRYRPGRLAADARDFDCDLWVKGFKKLPYHFVAFGGKPTHPLTHPMRVMRPEPEPRTRERETQLRAARPSRCRGLPVVRALSQTCLAAAVSAVTHLDSLSGRGFIMPREAIVMISARSALSCSESAKEQPTPKVAKPSAGAPPVWLVVRLRRASERR